MIGQRTVCCMYVLRARNRKSHCHRRNKKSRNRNAMEMNFEMIERREKIGAAQAVYISQHDGDGLCGGAYSTHELLHSSGKGQAPEHVVTEQFSQNSYYPGQWQRHPCHARSCICRIKSYISWSRRVRMSKGVLSFLVIALSCARNPALTAGNQRPLSSWAVSKALDRVVRCTSTTTYFLPLKPSVSP